MAKQEGEFILHTGEVRVYAPTSWSDLESQTKHDLAKDLFERLMDGPFTLGMEALGLRVEVQK